MMLNRNKRFLISLGLLIVGLLIGVHVNKAIGIGFVCGVAFGCIRGELK